MNSLRPEAFSTVLEALRSAQRVVLSTHINPDGDALGSELALDLWLRRMGTDSCMINHSPTPAVYAWLDPERRIRSYEPSRDDELLRTADLIVLLDANHPDRVRSMKEAVLASPARRMVIDHHLDPHPFGDITLIDEDATSTGELLYRLFTNPPGETLDADIATALYCAIMTDTGPFRYPRVDADIFRIAAHLVELGANPVTIYSNVYEQWTDGRIHLLGEMLAGMHLSAGGRVAHVTVTQDMLARTGTTDEDTDNFTVYPMSVRGVLAGILFLELPDEVKMSFRSRGDVPINDLAREFGGNGHKNAAGARVRGRKIADVVTDVLGAAEKYVRGESR